jgi:hypothetical protein
MDGRGVRLNGRRLPAVSHVGHPLPILPVPAALQRAPEHIPPHLVGGIYLCQDARSRTPLARAVVGAAGAR